MLWDTTTIAIAGILVGVLTNLLPILGGNFFNFATGILIVGYQDLAQKIGWVLIPETIYVFTIAYFVGTFGIKVLSLLPIPYLQPIAMSFRGR